MVGARLGYETQRDITGRNAAMGNGEETGEEGSLFDWLERSEGPRM